MHVKQTVITRKVSHCVLKLFFSSRQKRTKNIATFYKPTQPHKTFKKEQIYVYKIASVPVNRKAYNDMREKEHAGERERKTERE